MMIWAIVAVTIIPQPVARAVTDAVAVPGARVQLSAYRAVPASCAPREARVDRPYSWSGEVKARFTGENGCTGAALIHATVRALVWVTARPARSGDVVEAVQEERELRGEPLADVPPGARAAKAIAKGSILEAGSLRSAAGPSASKGSRSRSARAASAPKVRLAKTLQSELSPANPEKPSKT